MIIKTQRDGFLHGVPSEITPAGVYQQRRTLMKHLATGVAGAAALHKRSAYPCRTRGSGWRRPEHALPAHSLLADRRGPTASAALRCAAAPLPHAI